LKTTILNILGFLLLASPVMTQDAPEVYPADLPDMKIVRTRHFDGSSLWGYMDGGADLYLEYGFTRLTVQELKVQDNSYKVEIFRMKDSLSSFGIFSVLRFRCPLNPFLTPLACVNSYHVLFSKGRYLVSIVNETGTDDAFSVTFQLARKIEGRIDGPEFTEPAVLRMLFSTTERTALFYARGPLGLQKGNPDLEPLLGSTGFHRLFFLPVERDSLQGTMILLQFEQESNKEACLSSLRKHVAEANPSAQVKTIDLDKNGFLWFEYIGDPAMVERWMAPILKNPDFCNITR
jgi:hypothetical protein